jgi:hypothetical protein
MAESMASGISNIWYESTGLFSLFLETLLIPLANALDFDNLVVALVTGPIGNVAVFLPLSQG